MFHRRWKQAIANALAVCTLAACGGGSGSGGDGGGPPPPPPPPPPTFTVGGSISGLVGSVTLQNTGGAQLTVSANGTFTFVGTVAPGSSYDVTVATQPELQACTVANGSGTASANVTNIAISCADTTQPPTLSLSLPAIKTVRFAWTSVPGITRYKLFEDPTGESEVFTQIGADIDVSTTSLDHIVALHLRVNARYRVQACAATRCIDSNTVRASGPLVEAVGYFKSASIGKADQFGFSVALSADARTLAVGVPFEDSNATGVDGGDPGDNSVPESGAVYVFVRNGVEPVWEQQAYIKASNAETGDLFGHTVALDSSGSTLAVSAPFEDGTTSNSGAVYVFERSNGVWTEQPVLTASNAGNGDEFGFSLALSDQGQLAIGAPDEDDDGDAVSNSGAVYVFVREAAAQGFTWREDQYLKASNIGENDRLGSSVALSRDGATLAVGAVLEDGSATGVGAEQLEGSTNSGAVYVFTHDGQWTQSVYIKASNTGERDNFGFSLALSEDGSTLAVGAVSESSAATGIDNGESDDTASGAGAAYVFVRTGDEWRQQSYIKASNTGANDFFASSLALSADGSILAVGAASEDSSAIGIGGEDSDNSAAEAGAVYVFERSDDAWAQRSYLKPSNTSPGYVFGFAVALSGDGATLAAGAHFEDGSSPAVTGDQLTADAGAVYVY